jgi:hypothetical protein
MFKQSANVIPCIRSLRTTGSRCSVVIFTDSGVYNSVPFIEFLTGCGVSVINIGALFSHERNYLFMLRNSACYDFLRLREALFDRVILIDLFDTVFQGDPFTEEITRDTIAFSVETAVVRGNHLKGAAILIGSDAANRHLGWKHVINCGTVIGTTQTVLAFLGLEFHLTRRLPRNKYVELIETNYPDQALVNVLVRMDMLASRGMNVRLYDVDELYVTTYKLYTRPYNFRLGFYRPNATYPVLVHNFDRVASFCRSIIRACPQQFATPDHYVRCMA